MAKKKKKSLWGPLLAQGQDSYPLPRETVPSSHGDGKAERKGAGDPVVQHCPSRESQSQVSKWSPSSILETLSFAGIHASSSSSYKHRVLLSISPVPLSHTAQRTSQTANVCLQEAATAEGWPARRQKDFLGASLVAQWLRICLPMQGTRVRALVWEDPTCRGATGPVSHNC